MSNQASNSANDCGYSSTAGHTPGWGYLSQVNTPLNGNTFTGTTASGASYGAAGQMLAMTYFSDGCGMSNVPQTWTYNNRLQMTGHTYSYRQGTGTITGAISYADDSVSNDGKLASMTEPTGETVTYAYDELQRLTNASTNNNAWSQAFTYDGFGNLYKKTGTGSAAGWSWDYTGSKNSALNRVGPAGYDANGNYTGQGYTYDGENRLTGYYTPFYTYSMGYAPDNKRVYRKQVSNTTGQVVENLYFYVGNERIGICYLNENSGGQNWISCGDEISFAGRKLMLTNRLGSDAKSNLLPYGEEMGGTGTADSIKFATYWRDTGGLDYANQRFYSASLGRFLTADPYIASAGVADPSSWNRYAYVQGDPVNHSDPSGLIMSGAAISGSCPVGVGEKRVMVPCYLLQLSENNGQEALMNEWENLPDECNKGLRAKYGAAPIRSMLTSLNRVVALMDTSEKAAHDNGIDPTLLAAVALKENNGGNGLQRCAAGVTWGDRDCSSAGVFQIDPHYHPEVSKEQAPDESFAADWAAKLLRSNMTILASTFPKFKGDVLLQATAASYNLGPNKFSGDPTKIDVGSRGTPQDGYGANLLQLKECF